MTGMQQAKAFTRGREQMLGWWEQHGNMWELFLGKPAGARCGTEERIPLAASNRKHSLKTKLPPPSPAPPTHACLLACTRPQGAPAVIKGPSHGIVARACTQLDLIVGQALASRGPRHVSALCMVLACGAGRASGVLSRFLQVQRQLSAACASGQAATAAAPGCRGHGRSCNRTHPAAA